MKRTEVKINKDFILYYNYCEYFVKIPDFPGILIIDKSIIIKDEINYLLVDIDKAKVCLFNDLAKLSRMKQN